MDSQMLPPHARNAHRGPQSHYGYSLAHQGSLQQQQQQQHGASAMGGYYGNGSYDPRAPRMAPDMRNNFAQTGYIHNSWQQQQQQQQHAPAYNYYNEVPQSPSDIPPSTPTLPSAPGRPRASSRSSGSSASGNTLSDPEELLEYSSAKARPIGTGLHGGTFPFISAASDAGLSSAGGSFDGNGPCADPVLTGPADTSILEKPRQNSVSSGGYGAPPTGSPPNTRNPQPKRRPNNRDANSNATPKHRKPGRDVTETYFLKMPDSDDEDDLSCASDCDIDFAPMATLTDVEYKDIFFKLNKRFCKSSFRWLAQYKFKIPKKSYMRDHVYPDDRELTEYVAIIKTLIEQREIPRYSVRDERINELASVMEGASEIRHVTIHVSRKHKPDARVLGFIAAVSEFCWILGDPKGATETNRLYRHVAAITRARQEERALAMLTPSASATSVGSESPVRRSPTVSQTGSRRGSHTGSSPKDTV